MTTTQQNQQYYRGTGRRKAAVAQVRVSPGAGVIVINGKPLEQAVPLPQLRHAIVEPLRVTNTEKRFNAMVKVEGGGYSAQAIAVRHGLARALVAMDERYRQPLRGAGLLTRDARIKERRKYGLRKARKAPQYTKR